MATMKDVARPAGVSNLAAVTSAVQVRLTMAMMGLRIDLREECPRVA